MKPTYCVAALGSLSLATIAATSSEKFTEDTLSSESISSSVHLQNVVQPPRYHLVSKYPRQSFMHFSDIQSSICDMWKSGISDSQFTLFKVTCPTLQDLWHYFFDWTLKYGYSTVEEKEFKPLLKLLRESYSLSINYYLPNNFGTNFLSNPEDYISLDDANDDMILANDQSIFEAWEREFQQIPVTPEDVKMRAYISSVDRYEDVLPYVHNMIILSDGTMINASLMFSKAYIATQCPVPRGQKYWQYGLEGTEAAFWRMIAEAGSDLIVMLAPTVEVKSETDIRYHQYWPSIKDEFFEYEDGTAVRILSEKTKYNGMLIIREFEISIVMVDGYRKEHIVKHVQTEQWVDRKPVDERVIFAFMSEMYPFHNKENATVIHCSAGIGRTGTLMTIDIAFKALLDGVPYSHDLVKGIVERLRQDRTGQIQTKEQYVFTQAIVLNLARHIINAIIISMSGG